MRKAFGTGGRLRLRHTLPATIFATFRFLLRFIGAAAAADHRGDHEQFETRVVKVFNFALNTISAIRLQAEMPELALRLYLQGALVSDRVAFEKSASFTYECISKVSAGLISSIACVHDDQIGDKRRLRPQTSFQKKTLRKILSLSFRHYYKNSYKSGVCMNYFCRN